MKPNPLGVWLAFGGGAVVGAIVIFAAPLQYRATAVLKLDVSNSSPGGPAVVPHEWMVGGVLASPAHQVPDGFRIEPDPVSAETIRLHVKAPGFANALRIVQAEAERIVALAEKKREAIRHSVSEGERALGQWARELQERLHGAQAQLLSARSALPADDPRSQRGDILSRWQDCRVKLDQKRSEIESTAAELERIRAEPPPTQGVISPQRREEVLGADAGLQQDLKELTVRLSEVRSRLAGVHQSTQLPLQQLLEAARNLCLHCRPSTNGDPVPIASSLLPALTADCESYLSLTVSFAENWNGEYAGLGAQPADPLSARWLEAQPRLRMLVSDYLFQASGLLTSLRERIRGMAEGEWDQARHYVLLSTLTRAFEELQRAHHRFEFVAAGLDPRENFRLDSALNGARGLRRRSQHQIQLTEQALQAEALEQVRALRGAHILELESRLAELRRELNRMLAELVETQDALNHSAGRTEEFLNGVLHAELADLRFVWTRDDLEKTEQQLLRFAEDREAAAQRGRVVIVRTAVDPWPINVRERVTVAGLIALCCALIFRLVLAWTGRRRIAATG